MAAEAWLCLLLALSGALSVPHSFGGKEGGASTNRDYMIDLAGRLGTTQEGILDLWKKDASSNRKFQYDLQLFGGQPLNQSEVDASAGQERQLTVAIVQLSAVYKNPQASREKADSLLRPIGNEMDLIVLPEMALHGYKFDSAEDIASIAEPAHGPTFEWAKGIATQKGAWVMVGYAERDESGTYHNSALVVNEKGELVSNVRKMNLTPSDAKWASGEWGPMTVLETTKFGRLGIAICADLSVVTGDEGTWAADQFFKNKGVNMIVLMAAWDDDKPAEEVHQQWFTRLGSHIGTNTIFVAADRVGEEKGVPFNGASAVVDMQKPTTLAKLDTKEENVLMQQLKQSAGKVELMWSRNLLATHPDTKVVLNYQSSSHAENPFLPMHS